MTAAASPIRRSLVAAAVWLTIMGTGPPARAQSLTGTVAGRVSDQHGGVLPGVAVTLSGTTGGHALITDGRGEFRFVGLDAGTYAVTAELQGFDATHVPDLELGIGKTINLNLDLEVSGVSERVQVTAGPVAIDASTTAIDTTLAQPFLFGMPIARSAASAAILNNAPGINNGAAYGGGANSGNALLLDGVDIRDPESDAPWTTINYNVIEAVQVGGLGAPAEYGGFTGALVNTLTKSGGNRFAALAELRFTNGWLNSDNITSGITAANPSLAQASLIRTLTDFTAQLGGPIRKEKLFFFGSIQRYSRDDDPIGPRTVRTERSDRFNAKLAFVPAPADNITLFLQYDRSHLTGLVGLAGNASTQPQTVDGDAPESIWSLQYRKVFGQRTFLEAKYTGYAPAYTALTPIDSTPAHTDENGAWAGGAGSATRSDRTRRQINLGLSRYSTLKGTHAFKFGAEIERSGLRDRFAYSGGVLFYDSGRLPYLAYSYLFDTQATITRNSFYAQDQWKIGRATVNYGLRADHVHGADTTTGARIYNTASLGPRVGVAVDIFATGRSVLRAYYGRLYEGANAKPFEQAVSGTGDRVTYEVGPAYSTLTEVDRVVGVSKFTVDHDIAQAGLDEFNMSWEQQLRSDTKISATTVYRHNINFISSVLPDARWSPVPRTNPLTGLPLTVYRWNNRSVGERYQITNEDGFGYLAPDDSSVGTARPSRDYSALILALRKAKTHRWAGQVSYVWSRTAGTVDNLFTENQQSEQFVTPNRAVSNAQGLATNDRTHEFKTFVSYDIPAIDVSLNAYHRFLSGATYNAVQRLGPAVVNYSFPVDINLEPPGSRRNDRLSLVDLRAEKVFRGAVNRFGIYLDLSNLFNAATVTARQTRYPSRSIAGATVLFDAPTAVTPGRQAIAGVRWWF
jgi:Carboxypeptidase regulatory-like domain